jgi:hypothetical protein
MPELLPFLKKRGMDIMSLVFHGMSKEKVIEWLKDKGIIGKPVQAEGGYVVNVRDKDDFVDGSIRDIGWYESVTAAVGLLSPALQKSVMKRVPDRFAIDAEKLHFLEDLDITEVTLTKAPCVGKMAEFSILKSASAPQINEVVPISKVDKKQQIVGAYVTVPDVPDWEGSMVSSEHVEKAAHSFMKNMSHRSHQGSGTGHEHSRFEGIGHPVESFVDREGIHGIKGGWWLETHVTCEKTWECVEKGEIIGYSLGGNARKVPAAMTPPLAKSEIPADEISFFRRMKNYLMGEVAAEKAGQSQKTEQETKIQEEEMTLELLKKLNCTPAQLEELVKAGVDIEKAAEHMEGLLKAVKMSFALEREGASIVGLMNIVRNGEYGKYVDPQVIPKDTRKSEPEPAPVKKSTPADELKKRDEIIEKLMKANEDLISRFDNARQTRKSDPYAPAVNTDTDNFDDDDGDYSIADGMDFSVSSAKQIVKSMTKQ